MTMETNDKIRRYADDGIEITYDAPPLHRRGGMYKRVACGVRQHTPPVDCARERQC